MWISIFDAELSQLPAERQEYFNGCGDRQTGKTVFEAKSECYKQLRTELEAAKRAAWVAKNPLPTPPAGRPVYPPTPPVPTGYANQTSTASTPPPTSTSPATSSSKPPCRKCKRAKPTAPTAPAPSQPPPT